MSQWVKTCPAARIGRVKNPTPWLYTNCALPLRAMVNIPWRQTQHEKVRLRHCSARHRQFALYRKIRSKLSKKNSTSMALGQYFNDVILSLRTYATYIISIHAFINAFQAVICWCATPLLTHLVGYICLVLFNHRYSEQCINQPHASNDPRGHFYKHGLTIIPAWGVAWNHLSIPKLQWCNRWSLGMDK